MIKIIDRPTQQRRLKVIDPVGLHARPATQLVAKASSYKNLNIDIEYEGKSVNAKSIMGVMSLAIPENAQFTLIVQSVSPSMNKETSKLVEDCIDEIVESLIDQDIVEEIDMGETNIPEEIDTTFSYLKRFPQEELIEIVSGVLHKCCDLDNWNYNELIEKLRD